MANYIAIDLDTNGLYAVAGNARGIVKVTHALPWCAEDGEAPPTLALDTARAFGEKLRDKLKALGASPAPVIVSVGRDRVILKEIKHPPVPPTEEAALVRFQAIKEMSESPDDIVLDYAPLANGENPEERRAMTVMLRKGTFHAIQAMVTAAGLKLAAVTPRPYAVAAGLVRVFAAGTVPAPNKADAVVALTLSPNGGEFTVVRGGEVTLTLAIPSPVMASETMLVAQLRRNLAVYAGSHPTHPIQAVYLAEVGSGWAEKLGTALGLPVHAYDPLAGAVPQIAEPLRGRFAGAVGLLAGKSHESLPINFASPRQPIAERDPGKRRLVFAALAAVLLLAAGAAFGFMMLNAANKRVEALTQTKNELTEKINNGKSNTTRLNAIESWAKREVNYLEELHDLADRLPPDDTVRISSITSNPLPVGKDGKQESQAKMQISLVAVGPAPVNTMVSAMERDNAGGKKFYTKTEQATRPAPPPGTPAKFAQAFSVNTNVAHREPEQYLRKPTFTPPKKSWGAFGGTPVAPPETPPDATAKTPPDVAPMPSEPMMPFEEIP